ncbi:MAG TPA: ATP synthase F1 subunit epsilon [Candidatus Mcinerneyibacteriales bacterium]|nr:ATP synthase F1 subunit epsilon [Candidatus Mcinerneyibacteriales bacterium]
MAELVLKIVVPEGVKAEEEVQMLILPGAAGEFSVYPHHISMVTPLIPGKITISFSGKKERILATSGGICEVDPRSVTLILRSAEFADEIDVSRAQKAKERAEKRLSSHDEEIDVKRAQSALHRALIRLDVAETLSRF